ncbi:MAG: bacteriophage abortive infection AbiH family protein [Clostridiales bacterium]|nr:bacteriophage abortive infection AbiH family protein [Clostridiales bacterium]
MNITFFVGNGFDINIGLKTRYSDFYPYFVEKASKGNMIRGWLTADELRWADLEAELGRKLCLLPEDTITQDIINQFYEDKDELDLKLLEYLEIQQRQISVLGKEAEIAAEMVKSLTIFSQDLPEANQDSLQKTYAKYSAERFQYYFVCFNYTNSLNQIVNITKDVNPLIGTHKNGGNTVNNKLGSVVHIHGTLEADMILGVNDSDQINNNVLKADIDFLNMFTKQKMIESTEQQKIDHVKKILQDSRVVCIFGMSMGMTDKMWWQELVNWLGINPYNKMVVFCVEDKNNLQGFLPAKMYRLRNEVRETLLGYAGVFKGTQRYNDLCNRIFVAFNSQLFNFGNILFPEN